MAASPAPPAAPWIRIDSPRRARPKYEMGRPGCKEDDGHGCRFGKRQIRRHLRHGLGLRRDDGTKTRRGKTHYCISGHNVRDVLTDSRHDAGCFKPHGGTREPIFQSFFRQQPHRPHYVTELSPVARTAMRTSSGASTQSSMGTSFQ